MKRVFISLLLFVALGFFAPKVFADCQILYGGGETCTSYNFYVQKFVQVPGTSNFVGNIYPGGPTYSLSQTVNFQIAVVNTGDSTISTITVVDTFPQFVSFVSGPGTFNSSNNTLTFVVNNLGAGQTQTFNVSGKIAGSGVPTGAPCIVNQVTGTDNNGNSSNSSSEFCIQNGVTPTLTPALLPVVPVTKTPPTGPEMLPIALLIPGALSGLYLRRKSKNGFGGGEK
jgi:uncharacterized repeat protein (TIGR01451 family)